MKTVRAAGGVVWRDAPDWSGVEIAVVHRDRYDDWSLPKGKLDSGEHPLAAAVREVWEETGVLAEPQVRLPTVSYITAEPETDKSVDFWSMRAVSTSQRTATEEVDEVRWVAAAKADTLLTYAHDRGLVAAFAALPRVTGVAVLVRHAKAGNRSDWAGEDDQRPLDEAGKRQVDALGPLLALFRPARVYAAPLVRCVDTVGQIGLPVRRDTVFAEDTAAPPKAVVARLRALVAESARIVVCSQGGVIPDAVAALRPPNAAATATFSTPKGSGWVLTFHDAGPVAADRLTL
ncbi:MAG TPA: NUDIX domain-containing protein [Micromonosporaceae bacterium]|nr:NUDIX domain-containing protein [Micromonosporaceae bacterium]